ncbi:MAG: class I SAM-dependent methyltransferase [Candidatus Roizmanbacteria bacterium]|nr:class I SAM-dependent methyltransferase [Candidatus Roizmanbacteria bacterium]
MRVMFLVLWTSGENNYKIAIVMGSTTLVAQKITQCRVCGNTDLIPCIDIGEQYLSSVFPEDLTYRASAIRYPLDLVLCRKKEDGTTCGLLQLAHRLDLTPMYDAYPYTSSTNSSMGLILKDVAESGRALQHLSSDDVILDIGGNDGTLLSYFQNDSYQLLNIDPAKNITASITSPRYRSVHSFFNADAFNSVSTKKAKLIFSIAMFYHLNDPLTFAQDVATCLDDEGVLIIQMAYLPAMIRTNMYDNIVHEHAGYYATQHVKWIMEKVGLEVFDVVENDVYGGSFRIFIKKKGAHFTPTERLSKLLQKEVSEGVFDVATYQAFMGRVEKTRTDLQALCKSIKAEGKSIWIYGASTKGNTILQYCGLGSNEIDAAADSNAFKIGKYVIGSDVLIKSEEEMHAAKPDYLLALPYSFVNAFIQREADLVAQGTKFIVPLPEVKVLDTNASS